MLVLNKGALQVLMDSLKKMQHYVFHLRHLWAKSPSALRWQRFKKRQIEDQSVELLFAPQRCCQRQTWRRQPHLLPQEKGGKHTGCHSQAEWGSPEWKMSCPWQGGWSWVISRIPSSPNNLWLCPGLSKGKQATGDVVAQRKQSCVQAKPPQGLERKGQESAGAGLVLCD